jgi:outer membrane protein assembly factor BamB
VKPSDDGWIVRCWNQDLNRIGRSISPRAFDILHFRFKGRFVWQKKGDGSDVPTPAVSDGKAYILSDKGVLTCVEVSSGKRLWSGQTEKNRHGFSSSPVLADGNIYITREHGKVFVLAQGDEFKIVSENELDGAQTVASPVFVNGHIVIRTDTHPHGNSSVFDRQQIALMTPLKFAKKVIRNNSGNLYS